MTRYMDALAGHYAGSVKISTPWEVAQDIVFLGKVVSKPTALTVLADRIVASGALIHSGACLDAILTHPLAPSSRCRCPTKFDLVDLFRAVSNSMTSAYNSTSIIDNISPVLRSLVHKWFTKHLLIPVSYTTPQTLRGRLDKVQEEWVCNKSAGRRTCRAVRDFICVLGVEFDSAQRLVVVGHGHNILKHLREDLQAFLPPDIGQWGEDTDGEIWVRLFLFTYFPCLLKSGGMTVIGTKNRRRYVASRTSAETTVIRETTSRRSHQKSLLGKGYGEILSSATHPSHSSERRSQHVTEQHCDQHREYVEASSSS